MKTNRIKVKAQTRCPIVCDRISYDCENDWYYVVKDGLEGLVDRQWKTIVPIKYNSVSYNPKYGFMVEENGLFGIISSASKEILPCIYEEDIIDVSGNFWGKTDGKFHLYDKAGKELCGQAFDDIWIGTSDLAGVKIDTQWGVISSQTGKMILEPMYQGVLPIYAGRIEVRQNDLWGLVDTEGNEILPTAYSALCEEEDGTICAKQDGEWTVFRLSQDAGVRYNDIVNFI